MDLDSHGFTDCENICLYAGRIRILWPMFGGAVSNFGSSRMCRQKTPPPHPWDAFENVWMVGLSHIDGFLIG